MIHQMTRATLERRRDDALATIAASAHASAREVLGRLTMPGIDDQAEHLVLVRESKATDRLLLANMLETTLHEASVRDHPSARRALELGLRPLDPDFAEVPTLRMRRGKERLAFYRLDDMWFVVSGSSGALLDDDGDNWFCSIATAVITVLRPRNLTAARVNRLGRSRNVLNTIQSACVRYVDRLHVEGRMLNPRDSHDDATLGFMIGFAIRERDDILEQLTIGRIHAWRQGKWIITSRAVPLGYELDKKRLTLSTDPNVINQVRAVLALAARDDVNYAQALKIMGDLGIRSRNRSKGAVPIDRSVAEHGESSNPFRSLYRWYDLYRYGHTVITSRVHTHHADQILGMPIKHGDGRRWLEFDYDADVPDGGWATDEVFDAIAARRAQTAPWGPTGGHAHKTRLPLSGLRIAGVNGKQLRLEARGTWGTYRIAGPSNVFRAPA